MELLKPSDDGVTRPGGPHCPLLQPPAFGFPHGPVRRTAPVGRKAVESRCRHRHWPCSSIAVHAVRGRRIDARQRPCLASPRSTVSHACSSDSPFQKFDLQAGRLQPPPPPSGPLHKVPGPRMRPELATASAHPRPSLGRRPHGGGHGGGSRADLALALDAQPATGGPRRCVNEYHTAKQGLKRGA